MKSELTAKGFTLIEIMVVIFLITLLLGLSAAVFSNLLPSQRMEATAREMMAAFRQARSSAITGSKWQTVFINMDKRSFGIEGTSAVRDIPDSVSVRVVDPVNGEITGGSCRFVFSPAGVAEGGTVILSAGKKAVSLNIDPVAGAVYSRVE